METRCCITDHCAVDYRYTLNTTLKTVGTNIYLVKVNAPTNPRNSNFLTFFGICTPVL